jgi:serine/threonine protein kinase
MSPIKRSAGCPLLKIELTQSLRAIPRHPHIVPVLDAFLDPLTHKLHLVMELMEINLYQFLKSRENKPLEPRVVQVILYSLLVFRLMQMASHVRVTAYPRPWFLS